MTNTVQTKANPKAGFWFCNFAFTLERFSYYSAKWLIIQFIALEAAKGGLGITDGSNAVYQSFFVAFTYLAPLFGSVLSDRFFGAKYLVPIGMALMSLGYFVGFNAHSLGGMALMIGLVSIGTGLFKPQTNSITGLLFSDKKELDKAFSTQYSMVNLGSFIGTTSIGLIAGSYGYRICFLICAVAMLINAVLFVCSWKSLGEVGARPFKENEKKDTSAADSETVEKKPLTKIEKQRIAAIVFVSAFSAIFWIFWYMAYLPVYDYWGTAIQEAGKEVYRMNWQIGSFQVPTSFFDSLNALVCIALGPILGMLWEMDARRPNGGLTIFKHTALGLGLLGVSFGIFAFADITRGGQPANLLWVVLFGFVLSFGEMTFSPLGNSFISKFAPQRLLSAMMAVWTCAIFIAGLSYGVLYNAISKIPFATSSFGVAALLIVVAAILWGMDGKLRSLVIEEKKD